MKSALGRGKYLRNWCAAVFANPPPASDPEEMKLAEGISDVLDALESAETKNPRIVALEAALYHASIDVHHLAQHDGRTLGCQRKVCAETVALLAQKVSDAKS